MNRAIPSLDTPLTAQPPDQGAIDGLGDELLTVNDAARFLRVTTSWVYEHTRDDAEDRLPFVKLGKDVRFDGTEGKTQQPKTQKVRWTIPLEPHVIALLKEHRDRATRKSADDLVFPTSTGRTDAGVKVAGAAAATGGGTRGAWACDVASVPPHSLVAAQRSPRAGEDRAGATGTANSRRAIFGSG